ncbi:hypothetical protein LOTGIDRAFT_164381 [Lottia gigantea]|uniref:Uncharacterized protein n=1 Tax=Lottia gigantea TaxID=225164 RepID=V3ZFV5_LOTGI|nr:hypothetical protein LOTGIDRAFT_164381 [Lottia gigantea]ESO90078.1 hypothetical protein LOTGIDRAFT_164381 [Lottia gigantea]
MLKTVLYPKNYDSVSGWIPDVGGGEVLKEPVRTVANDADLARIRVVARNTLERVTRGVNQGFEKRALQYNNVVEKNRWGNYVNWKLYPLFGLLEHRKVSIGLPYKIHLQREINDNKIFFGENNSDAKLEITNIQLYIPVITPSVEVETRIFNSLTKDIEIAFLRRNTLLSSGVGDILGTVKEFGQRFGEETKKTVKEGLSKLIDKIDTGEMKSINHGMDRDTFKKVCKAQWRNPDDHGYVFVNTRKPAGERVMIDIC